MANATCMQLLLIVLLFTCRLPSLLAAGGRRALAEEAVVAQPPAGGPPLKDDGGLRTRSHAREFLAVHNRIRRFVGEAPYVWSRSLAQYARRWADERRGDCKCIHSEGPYGENMFWGTGQDWRAADAVQSWGLEHYDYDPSSNSCRPGRMCGHYTQIVWNATSMIGCARAACDAGGVIMVCNYDPPGNFLGESPFQILD